MSYRKQRQAHWVIGILAILGVAMLWFGCNPGPAEVTPESEGAQGSGLFMGMPFYGGEISMDELILRADAIARVRFESVEQIVEPIHVYVVSNPYYNYAAALEFTFEVQEYLKGSGGTEIQAVAYDGDRWHGSMTEAEAANEDLLTTRERRWDDREAVVFLRKYEGIPSTLAEADRYLLGLARAWGEDGFTVASRWEKAWLPDAADLATGAGGAARVSGGEQRFLLSAPAGQASVRSQTGAAQAVTITMSNLKAIISALQAEVDAGGGAEGYEDCVLRKYSWPRQIQYYKERLEARGGVYRREFNEAIGSGLPSGTEVYVGGTDLSLSDEDQQIEPAYSDDLVVKTGQDADLFAKGWPLTAVTARPLPTGTYRFYWAEQDYTNALCDAMPEDHRNRNEVVVTVTPPPDTLHEAFFDPVSLASGVGADSSNGVLNPASFTVDGTSTSITGLKWESGSVVLSLSPYSSLSGHNLDFIELDGSVSLSLPVSSATADSSAGTLTWSVSDQPWHNGDLLMLRISPSTTPPPTPTPTPEPTPVPTLTPSPMSSSNVTVTLIPRTESYGTVTTVTIQWTDQDNCDFQYHIALYNSKDNVSRRFGSHPAPDTTSVIVETSFLWDAMPNSDLVARGSCEPLFETELRLVGEAELRSGLP